mgnify:FL=1
MQSPVALRPLAPPACFASPEAYTRAVCSTRRQRPHTVVIHASFNAPQTNGEAVKSFCSVARMSSIGSKNLGCRLCVKLPRLPAAMVIPEGYVLFSVMCGFGPLPLTCLFRYAFRSCGQLRRFRFPVPLIPYSRASRRRRMFFRAAFEVTAVRFPARSDGQRTVSPARFGKAHRHVHYDGSASSRGISAAPPHPSRAVIPHLGKTACPELRPNLPLSVSPHTNAGAAITVSTALF